MVISKGRTYGELCAEWTNWLIHPYPQRYNNGDVIFLRGIDFPDTYYDDNIFRATPKHGSEPNPMVSVGKECLEIPANGAVFFPTVYYFAESVDNSVPDSETARHWLR